MQETSTQVNGRTIKGMEEENNILQTVLYMKDIGNMIQLMVKED